jgi:acyl-CoA synthetase (AMP-forming)/AMP-acid ligase II
VLASAGGDLLDLLEGASGGRGVVRFLPDEPRVVPVARIWRASERAARWFSRRCSPGGSVGMVLGTGSSAVAALVGAWRAGLCVASLPTPGRAMPPGEYRAQIEAACACVGAELLLVEDALVPAVPPLSVPVAGFAGCASDGAGRTDGHGSLVQFTSGSTGAPKGIRLSLDAVAHQVRALLERLQPQLGDAACSWLPLSHDMGLIGMLLTSWCAASPDVLGGGELTLIRPEHFVRRPACWLDACSRFGATITSAPDFALALATRTVGALEGLDLRRLRVCITGGDMIRAATLEVFAAATAAAGFRSRAFCPAYGLAEATLAVTMVEPTVGWSAASVDAAALAEGRWVAATGPGARRVVCAGGPLPGMSVRVAAGPAAAGVIEVAGPSMLTEHVGYGSPLSPEGWLTTGDLGVLDDGLLYPTGRRGDRIVVAGRTLDAGDVEARIGGHPGLRAGAVVAVDDGAGGFAVVAEPAAAVGLDAVARAVRDELVRTVGCGPSAVVLVERGSLPKTPSGKLPRRRVADAFQSGSLRQITLVRFRAAAP